jgi:hypothetical protein
MFDLYVKPAVLPDGATALVRQPERAWAPLPPEGAFVPSTTYWHRRIRDRDVLEAPPPFSPEEVVPPPAMSGFEPASAGIDPNSAPARAARRSR